MFPPAVLAGATALLRAWVGLDQIPWQAKALPPPRQKAWRNHKPPAAGARATFPVGRDASDRAASRAPRRGWKIPLRLTHAADCQVAHRAKAGAGYWGKRRSYCARLTQRAAPCGAPTGTGRGKGTGGGSAPLAPPSAEVTTAGGGGAAGARWTAGVTIMRGGGAGRDTGGGTAAALRRGGASAGTARGAGGGFADAAG